MKAYQKVQGLAVLSTVFSIWAGLGINGAWAQSYPTKPVHIHTAGAGGGADTTSRMVAAELSGPLGQQVIVENRPAGAPLITGVAKSAPDGYTLMVVGAVLWTTQLFQETTWDPIKDFSPIINVVKTPNVLVIHPSIPAKNVAEFVTYAKAHPGQLNYSTGSTGSSSHMSAALFAAMAGADMVRVPYKDQSNESNDLMSGRVQFSIQSAPSVGPLVRGGKMVALAVSSAKKSSLFPDLPTIAETLPGYECDQMTVFVGPAKIPDAIVRRLNAETNKALAKADVKDRLAKTAQEPVGGTPEELAALMKSDLATLTKVFKTTGVATDKK